MSRVSPQDESEEGEIRPEQYRYSVGDRSDRDRDRRDAGIVHNPSFPNRRGPSVSDSRAPRDPSLDTDRIRKDLQAALSRPDGTLDSAVLAELLRSSNRKDTLERLLDRDREHGSSRSAGSRDHGSPEFRRDDRQYLRGRDNERDRHSVRDYPRDRPPSVGGGTSELAPPNREVWYGNRNRLHEGPGNREGSHHWQRGERPAIRTTPPSFSRPSMLATQQQPTVHAQGRPRSGSDVESTDEWRRQQRSNILNAGPEALRTTSSGSARAHVSRWSDGPVEDTGAQVRPAPAPGLLRSPPPMPAAQDSAPEVSTGQTTAGRQKDPTNGDVDEMYDISDGEGGEEIEEIAEPVGTSQPTELEPSAADASLELDLETLSLDKVVSVLEEMERSERSLQEQLRGMHHEFEDKSRQLSKLQHVLDKEAARVAAKEEQARLSKEERVRIAVAHEVLRQRRRGMLESQASSSDAYVAFVAARSSACQQSGDGCGVAWLLHTTPQSLQSVSDILRANRRAAVASCESLGLPVSVPVGNGTLHATPAVDPVTAYLQELTQPVPAHAKLADPPCTSPLDHLSPELPEFKRNAVAAVLHQRKQESRARLVALGAAYSVAVDGWDAKMRALEQAQGGKFYRVNSNGQLKLEAVEDPLDSLGAAGKTRAAKRRGMADSPGTPLVLGLGVSASMIGLRGPGSDILRSEWDLQQVLAELEQEDRKQRAREATAATLPNMLTPEEMACVAFDPCRNNLWSTHGGGPSCLVRRSGAPPSCGSGVFGCDCVAACDALNAVVNPWSDVEKLVFMDKFMQFPKDFVRIAKYLPNKTPQECTEFYYLTKHVAGYKSKLKKQSMAIRRRTGRNGWLLARQAATSIGVALPKAIAEGGGDNGVSRVVPVPAHMSDVQFSVTYVPVAPLHPPKVSADALGKKKKKKDKDGKETPVPKSHVSQLPTQPPVRTGAAGRPALMASPPSLGNRAPVASAWKPSEDARSRMEGFRSAVAAPSAVRATVNSAQASIVHTPNVQPPPAAAAVPSSTVVGAAPAPAPPPKPITICKELASLLGTPVPRSAASPVLRPGSAQDDKKRKREEESAPMAKWTPFERDEFVRLYKIHGREWSDIAVGIPTKTAAQVKNFYQNNKRMLQLDDGAGTGTPPPG